LPYNPFFDQLENEPEQNLYSDLFEESIEVMGDVMEYLPRRQGSYDKLLGEDPRAYFDTARTVPVYLENFDSFRGDRTFISKFGVEIRDQIVLIISRAMFEREVGQPEGFSRPREGDLFYFGKNGKCFEIKYVDYTTPFYPLGSLPGFRLTCELYEYSDERFETGIDEIDSIQTRLSTDVLARAVRDESGEVLTDENGLPVVTEGADLADVDPTADNFSIQQTANTYINFNEADPFNDGETY